MQTRHLLAIATAFFSMGAAQATLLTNGSFDEAGPVFPGGPNQYCYTANAPLACGLVPGWSGSFQIINSTSSAWQTPNTNIGWTTAQGPLLAGLQNSSYLSQTLLLSAGSYSLSWLDSNRKNYGGGNSYKVLFDNVLLDTFVTNPGDAWGSNSLVFNTGSGSHTLSFQALRTSGDGTSFIDNISLTGIPSQVPEPASLALLGLGLVGLGFSRRKRV